MARKPATEFKPFTAILSPAEADAIADKIKRLGFKFGDRTAGGDFMRMILTIPDAALVPYVEAYKSAKAPRLRPKHAAKFDALPDDKKREILALLGE